MMTRTKTLVAAAGTLDRLDGSLPLHLLHQEQGLAEHEAAKLGIIEMLTRTGHHNSLASRTIELLISMSRYIMAAMDRANRFIPVIPNIYTILDMARQPEKTGSTRIHHSLMVNHDTMGGLLPATGQI
jgi:hypothetical protein